MAPIIPQMAGVRAHQRRKAAYARSGELYDVYGIRTSRASIGQPPALDRHDAQWSGLGDSLEAGRTLVLNNLPQSWHTDSITNWASQFGMLRLVAADYENARAVIEFCDSECARTAYESGPISFCHNLYVCYWERSQDPLEPVLPPINESTIAPLAISHNTSRSDNNRGSPPLSPTLTEAYSETADMEISVLAPPQLFSLRDTASGGVTRPRRLVEAGDLHIRHQGSPPPSPTCTEGYSDDEDMSLVSPAYRLSCQIERRLQGQVTLAEVKSFSLEVEAILRGVEDTVRCTSSNLQVSSAPVAGSSISYSTADGKNGASSDPMSAVPPDMTLQVNLERSAYIQRIGKQLRDLLDIYDGFEAGAVQGTQLLESMRTIKRELDALDEEDKAYEKYRTWLASKTMSRWTRHRYPFAGWTVPLGNACTGPIDID